MASRTGRAEPLPGTAGTSGRRGAEVLALPPGRELRPETERWIVDGLVEAMPGLRARELFALRRDMLAEAGYIVVAVDPQRDAVVALLTSRWVPLPSGRPCLHVMTQFVGDAYRHGAIFGRSWAAHFARLLAEGRPFPEVIALKTYNPVVHCAMNAFAVHPGVRLYPDLTGAHDAALPLVTEVAGAVAPGHPFDAGRCVFPGAGRPVDLYRERPLSSAEAANAYFGRHLVPGDRMLCVLHAPTPAGQHGILTALGLARPE
ncbi:hypothetical protein AB0F13_12480 [Streptomyces sp. NPDC026206]|uniref:hypothetical protein n=1 Tax=Streptomyces sp. NPDC026206 TaxID=3157089 RepID=UPI0033DEEBD8